MMSALGNLEIHVLDVGQGDGIYIEFPDGKNMLVDLGSVKNHSLLQDVNFEYFSKYTRFKENGTTLDYLVLTHPDRDHHNLVKRFLEKFKNSKEAKLVYGGNEGNYDGLITELKNRGFDASLQNKDMPFELLKFPEGRVRVLAKNTPPKDGDKAWEKNTASVVLQIEYAGKRVLLTGDATTDTENFLMDLEDEKKDDKEKITLQSHVLKVSHHGSARTSSSTKFLDRVKPNYAIISSDRSGTIDDAKQTGYRLPDKTIVDRIMNLGSLATVNKHSYVVADKDKPEWAPGETEKAIFTTLYKIGQGEKDPDVGGRVDVVIRADGTISVTSTQ